MSKTTLEAVTDTTPETLREVYSYATLTLDNLEEAQTKAIDLGNLLSGESRAARDAAVFGGTTTEMDEIISEAALLEDEVAKIGVRLDSLVVKAKAVLATAENALAQVE
jgi:hypothetical protein